jgi:CBS domain-containing protein
MRVQDVMSEGVQTVAPTVSASTAWELMRTHGFHHLVVTDGGRIVGILSDRDAGGRQGASLRAGRTVAELMTGRVVTVPPTATLRQAANLMRGRSIGCLVVTARGRIVGIVTVADLLIALGGGIEHPRPAVKRWTLRHRVPRRKRTAATGVW